MSSANSSRDSCIVFDIDGVLADVRHRLHHLARRPKDWEAFFAAAAHDDVLGVGAELACAAAMTHTLVYLTGRPEWLRHDTKEWLRRHRLPNGPLFMRPDGDRRPAAAVKLQLLRALRNDFVIDLMIDDDPVVAEAVEKAGFPVKLADWMPRAAPVLHEAQERDGRT